MESRKMVLLNLIDNGPVDTEGEDKVGTNWESSIDIYTIPCIK